VKHPLKKDPLKYNTESCHFLRPRLNLRRDWHDTRLADELQELFAKKFVVIRGPRKQKGSLLKEAPFYLFSVPTPGLSGSGTTGISQLIEDFEAPLEKRPTK
jgi:hypothetical protein